MEFINKLFVNYYMNKLEQDLKDNISINKKNVFNNKLRDNLSSNLNNNLNNNLTIKYDKNAYFYNEGYKYLMQTYARLPVVFKYAKMQYLWDVNQKKYIDFIAGYGCLNVGHSNPYVLKMLQKQIKKIIQPSNVFFNIPQIQLAKKLCQITGFGEKVFFANSGTEAIEAAIKLARKFSREKFFHERYHIISFRKSFHGRTLGALSATAQEEKQNVYQPLLSGFKYANLNDIESVKKLIDENTCAVLLELIQGEGGINVCDFKFIEDLVDICKNEKILLIIDEVQTGFGRTGKMFAYQNYNFYPDILVLAKSLGGGMPIGAIVSKDEISTVFQPGSHGSTFGGNAASCAAGIAVIEYIMKNDLILKARHLSNYLFENLFTLKDKYQIVKEVRGMGLMLGIEFNKPVAGELVLKALSDGIVINKVSPEIIRLLPPLVINKNNIDYLIKWLDRSLKEL